MHVVLIFSENSQVNASEFLENLEKKCLLGGGNVNEQMTADTLS